MKIETLKAVISQLKELQIVGVFPDDEGGAFVASNLTFDGRVLRVPPGHPDLDADQMEAALRAARGVQAGVYAWEAGLIPASQAAAYKAAWAGIEHPAASWIR